MRRWISILTTLGLLVGLLCVPSLAEASAANDDVLIVSEGEALVSVEAEAGDESEEAVEEDGGQLLADLGSEGDEEEGLLFAQDGEAALDEPELDLPQIEGEAETEEGSENYTYQWCVLGYESCEYVVRQGFYWHTGPSVYAATAEYVPAGSTILVDTVIKNITTGNMWVKKYGEAKYVFAGYHWSGSYWYLDTSQTQYLDYSRNSVSVTWSDHSFPSGMTLYEGTSYALRGTLTANTTISAVQGRIYNKGTGVSSWTSQFYTNSMNKSYSLNWSALAQSVRFGALAPGNYEFDLYVVFPCNRMQGTSYVYFSCDFTILQNRDTVPPGISNVSITNVTSSGYTVSCRVSDNVGVTSVKFPTWTQNNGQDDLVWHQGQIVNGVASCTIRTADHNGETGCVYTTHIYAYDAAGNYRSVGYNVNVPAAIVGPTSVSLNKSSATLAVGKKLTLKATVAPSGAATGLKWKSSNKKVATVTQKGVVKAVASGKATITVTTDNGKTATCTVTVPKEPTGVKLNKSSATLKAGKKLTLKATVSPSGAKTTLKWKSSDKKVATVTQKGVVKAVGAGKATITVTTKNGYEATCRVTVPKAPKSVKLSKTSASLEVGKKLTLKATVSPSGAKTTLKWKSSDKKVATVTQKGVVKAVGGGKATITVTTANGKKAKCAVTVVKDKTVKYRALLIGQESFSPVCKRNSGDVALMAKMLGSVKGPEGGKYAVTKKYDLTRAGVLQAISSTFGGADDNDVSLFFIATHGDASNVGRYAGALAMPSGEFLLIEDLAQALSGVRGRVIVILEACGSGAAIYGNGDASQEYERLKRAAEAFDAAAVRAFGEADMGVIVDANGRGLSEDEILSNTGELRKQNKFYVLAASQYLELSWGSEVNRYNYFTKWLVNGVGTSGKMPADTGKDGVTNLNELYKYIAKVGNNYGFRSDGRVYYQHVQVYPAGSGYKLFKR